MASNDQIGSSLQSLQGELPAGGEANLTVFVCCHPSQLGGGLVSKLVRLDGQDRKLCIHLHVLDWSEQDRAQLTLLSHCLSHLDLSVTGESMSDGFIEAAPTALLEFGLIRLHEIHQRVPGQYVFCTGDLSADLDAIEQSLLDSDVTVWTDGPAVIAVNTTKGAQGFLVAAGRALIQRFNDGALTAGDGRRALSSVRTELEQRTAARISSGPALETPAAQESTTLDDVLHERLWSQTNSDGLRVLMPQPDMALPFKSPSLVAHRTQRAARSPLLDGSMGTLRRSWQDCFDRIAQALTWRGHRPVSITVPGATITPALANASGADVVIMPHRQSFQCPGLDVPALYLMQIAHRWLFTVDKEGWGAGAASYPYEAFADAPADSSVFDQYLRWISEDNDSKFDQPERKSRQHLVAEGILPDGDYIFFPCQIPDDEVVRFFCDVSEEDVIAALAAWANRTGATILFKAHPAAPHTSEPFKTIAKGDTLHWVDASVHDLIEHCQAVYTLNSGVGHEAILHGKPVVMFGRAEYDRLAIRSNLDELDDTYAQVKTWNAADALEAYRRFYHWFTRDNAIDLRADDTILEQALGRVVDLVEEVAPCQP